MLCLVYFYLYVCFGFFSNGVVSLFSIYESLWYLLYIIDQLALQTEKQTNALHSRCRLSACMYIIYNNASKHQPNNIRSVNLISEICCSSLAGFRTHATEISWHQIACIVSDTRYIQCYIDIRRCGMSANSPSQSQLVKVNHYSLKYCLQHRALADTEQQAIKNPKND